ncbi:acyl-CoA dehydrogenase family protein [Paenibacillus apiarius]|uniref:Acyl-CoA dehydrogenase n=1 Tax=Paenibacillus apiarius TaxID=46240 RepID=A0ABT4DMS9_9BACL|nr:acyl-CoA dehydrogenase [Paenibacillus apiarius]MCY9514675.1 acyl-CoA dehydrogenase [Paenibacillus apiarius]MCY9518665.1 acyl-CoA dehydrogenase [Paenibacillus apiarius]MCY9552894.1 acyl-CoA dehydrogenase [Paenibacillus apiarius]MCY9556919.1 acyl-CoA dehydrogenase [Paenibacillus apiarius]MCY9686128.1 acyl-CoA dehydrogenase [Paenibacillus apiarius]
MTFTAEEIEEIRSQALEMETKGKLPQQFLNWIYERGLFKLFVPRQLDGHMTPLPEALKWFEHASWINGSFGWLITIGSGGGFFAPFVAPSVARAVFASPQAVVAGSGHPSGTAKQVKGGYTVSGRWKFCSGSTHATVFTANCIVDTGDSSATPQIRSFIFWPDQIEIIKDWKAFGLKATESHSIAVNELFVPKEMTFDISQPADVYADPVYTYPFLPFAEASFAAVSIGVSRHFLDEARLILERNKEAWESSTVNRYAAVRGKIDKMDALLARSVKQFYEVIEESWARHVNGQPLSEEESMRVSRQCKQTGSAALSCADSIFPYMGIHAVMEDTALNQIFRDLHTVCHHSLLVAFE